MLYMVQATGHLLDRVCVIQGTCIGGMSLYLPKKYVGISLFALQVPRSVEAGAIRVLRGSLIATDFDCRAAPLAMHMHVSPLLTLC